MPSFCKCLTWYIRGLYFHFLLPRTPRWCIIILWLTNIPRSSYFNQLVLRWLKKFWLKKFSLLPLFITSHFKLIKSHILSQFSGLSISSHVLFWLSSILLMSAMLILLENIYYLIPSFWTQDIADIFSSIGSEF